MLRWNSVPGQIEALLSRHSVFRTLWALLVMAGLPECSMAGQTQNPTRFEYTGFFASPGPSESSGVAVSRENPGVL